MKKSLLLYRRWLSMVVLSAVLMALVAYASDQTIGLFECSIVTTILLISIFHSLFGSSSTFFNIVFANGITIYLCFFTFFIENNFHGMSRTIIAIGFVMPMLAFLAGMVAWRREILKILEKTSVVDDANFARSFLWFFPIVAIGIGAFILHQTVRYEVWQLQFYFLGEMGAIAAIVFLASKDLALILMDTGYIFQDFFAENARLIKPAFAFFTFYSMNIIIFGAVYRVIERLSDTQHFIIRGEVRDLNFVESVYFSMVTASTLGYGDIVPLTNIIRFIVGVQSFLSTLLLIFGVHAVMTHRNK